METSIPVFPKGRVGIWEPGPAPKRRSDYGTGGGRLEELTP